MYYLGYFHTNWPITLTAESKLKDFEGHRQTRLL